MTGLMYTHVLIYGLNCMLSLGRFTSESQDKHQAFARRATVFENQPLAFEADVKPEMFYFRGS